jgi:hypothetical protein
MFRNNISGPGQALFVDYQESTRISRAIVLRGQRRLLCFRDSYRPGLVQGHKQVSTRISERIVMLKIRAQIETIHAEFSGAS